MYPGNTIIQQSTQMAHRHEIAVTALPNDILYDYKNELSHSSMNEPIPARKIALYW